MGKTITIDYKGGSRRVELQRPPEKKMIYRLAMAPVPIRMDYESLDWIIGTLAMGTDIPREQIEDMDITAGYPLFNDVINYWREVVDPDYDDSQVQELIEGMELNKDGSVDLEEMQ
jgi:hypothetical protein